MNPEVVDLTLGHGWSQELWSSLSLHVSPKVVIESGHVRVMGRGLAWVSM